MRGKSSKQALRLNGPGPSSPFGSEMCYLEVTESTDKARLGVLGPGAAYIL